MAAPASREFGGGRTYITFAPPLRSDGVSDNCCPHPEAQDKPEYYSKYLAHFIFTIAGCCLAQGAEWPAPSNQAQRYVLRQLPPGYKVTCTWPKEKDFPIIHIAGHPSGRCFEKIEDLALHLRWLYDLSKGDSYCTCSLCAEHHPGGDRNNIRVYEADYWVKSDISILQFPCDPSIPCRNPLQKPHGSSFMAMLGTFLPVQSMQTIRTGIATAPTHRPHVVGTRFGVSKAPNVHTANTARVVPAQGTTVMPTYGVPMPSPGPPTMSAQAAPAKPVQDATNMPIQGASTIRVQSIPTMSNASANPQLPPPPEAAFHQLTDRQAAIFAAAQQMHFAAMQPNSGTRVPGHANHRPFLDPRHMYPLDFSQAMLPHHMMTAPRMFPQVPSQTQLMSAPGVFPQDPSQIQMLGPPFFIPGTAPASQQMATPYTQAAFQHGPVHHHAQPQHVLSQPTTDILAGHAGLTTEVPSLPLSMPSLPRSQNQTAIVHGQNSQSDVSSGATVPAEDGKTSTGSRPRRAVSVTSGGSPISKPRKQSRLESRTQSPPSSPPESVIRPPPKSIFGPPAPRTVGTPLQGSQAKNAKAMVMDVDDEIADGAI